MRSFIIFLLTSLLITSVIISSWFSSKTFVSNNSEENLDFINFSRTAEHYSTTWSPIGTGVVNIFEFVRYPFLKILSLLHSLGFEPFLIQAFSYWIIMNAGLICVYLLLRNGFFLNRIESAIGSYFYLLNIYSMTQIWKRNIYQGMFPWAYLPLFILLWMKWVNEGKVRWLIGFAVSISIFSHAFAHPGYFFVYLVTGGIFALIKFRQNWNKKRIILKLFLRVLIAFLIGILLNIWWLYPFIHNSTAQGAKLEAIQNEWKAHLDSVAGVSKYFGTFDILLLRQKHYFEKNSELSTEWFFFYDNFLTILISLIGFLIVIYGVIKSKTKKYFKYLFSIFLIGWFVSKGTNFPFGGLFYNLLFSYFPFTAALRNPYEKFGIVWLLPYSIFFALGLYHLAAKINLRWRYLFIGSSMVLFCGILVYPFWNGDIFPPKHRLTIPVYYIEANDYLNLNLSKRSFHIPFSIQAELLKYSWGYIGQDPIENLFDSQNVSRSDIPIFNDYFILIKKYLSKKYLPRILGSLGVDHIILHHDMIYPELDLNVVKANQWQEIKKDRDFGPLFTYSLDSSIVKPEIYTTASLTKFDSLEQALDKISSGEFDTSKNSFTNTSTSLPFELSDSAVNITFKKISKTRYQVQAHNTTSPFVLVLNETFNNFWIARVGNKITNNHFLVNGFANGWLIDEKGDYSIDIILKIWPWE